MTNRMQDWKESRGCLHRVTSVCLHHFLPLPHQVQISRDDLLIFDRNWWVTHTAGRRWAGDVMVYPNLCSNISSKTMCFSWKLSCTLGELGWVTSVNLPSTQSSPKILKKRLTQTNQTTLIPQTQGHKVLFCPLLLHIRPVTFLYKYRCKKISIRWYIAISHVTILYRYSKVSYQFLFYFLKS